ncbi:MAG: PD40 domain-containing protein, partial [Anaerolineae bacterium]|nr:PD40 domain-containing protein [Anaerolineae bacterium]
MNPRFSKSIWQMVIGFVLVVSLTSTESAVQIRAAGVVTRVSVDSNEMQANAMSYIGDISADGRFVAFDSEATNLVLDDTNGVGDVFLRDLQLGTTVRVSVTATGEQANSGGGGPSVSADGRFVAFESGSTNFVEGDTNGYGDIYVKDMVTGTVARASLTSTGGEPNNESMTASISGDGRFVVFDSDADNLVPNDTNGVGDIFVRDMQLGTTTGVTVSGNAGGLDGSISLDGRFVVFNSRSTNFVPDDTNEVMDVFVYSIQTGQIVRASVNSSGVQG